MRRRDRGNRGWPARKGRACACHRHFAKVNSNFFTRVYIDAHARPRQKRHQNIVGARGDHIGHVWGAPRAVPHNGRSVGATRVRRVISAHAAPRAPRVARGAHLPPHGRPATCSAGGPPLATAADTAGAPPVCVLWLDQPDHPRYQHGTQQDPRREMHHRARPPRHPRRPLTRSTSQH